MRPGHNSAVRKIRRICGLERAKRAADWSPRWSAAQAWVRHGERIESAKRAALAESVQSRSLGELAAMC
jgi:hypothetical protein